MNDLTTLPARYEITRLCNRWAIKLGRHALKRQGKDRLVLVLFDLHEDAERYMQAHKVAGLPHDEAVSGWQF